MKLVFKHILSISFGISLICLALLTACISPVDIQPSNFEPILVVEGFMTNDEGPYEIRITRLARFAGITDGGEIRVVEGAIVTIEDDLGNRTPLERTPFVRKELFNEPPGCFPTLIFANLQTNYRTPANFRGEIGRTYVLEIITDGNVYRSSPQMLSPTPPIDSLHLDFVEIPTLNAVTPRSGVDVFATWDDPAGENFYSWRMNGIYRISTPDLSGPNSTACCLFDPTDDGLADCWIQEPDLEGNVQAMSDRFFDGRSTTEKVGFIEDDGLRFSNNEVPSDRQYYVEVEQFSIPREAFDFFERIEVLSTIDGEIFDPPPLSIRGNIFNIENPNERVIGYFGAFAVQKAEIFVPEDLLDFKQTFPQVCGDCRVRPGAQVEIPEPYQ